MTMTSDQKKAMEDIIITKAMVGICHMQVCAIKSLSDKEIVDYANRFNPSGTSNGWSCVVRDDDRLKPVQCEDHPDRQHLILVC